MSLLLTFHESWKSEIHKLETLMEDARERGFKIANMMECLKTRERTIEANENALILEQTKPDGIINGKNEETRKAQRAAFLETIRQQDPLLSLYSLQEHDKLELIAVQQLREENLDAIVISKMKLNHYDSVLRALQGGAIETA